MTFFERLIAIFREVYPEVVTKFETHIRDDQELLDLICFLASIYTEQNHEIHTQFGGHGYSLAEQEELWIEAGRPAQSLASFQSALTESQHLRLCEAWNEFQLLLLFGEHSQQVRWDLLGRIPDEASLLNDAWNKWANRLRKRFEPILDQCRENVD